MHTSKVKYDILPKELYDYKDGQTVYVMDRDYDKVIKGKFYAADCSYVYMEMVIGTVPQRDILGHIFDWESAVTYGSFRFMHHSDSLRELLLYRIRAMNNIVQSLSNKMEATKSNIVRAEGLVEELVTKHS